MIVEILKMTLLVGHVTWSKEVAAVGDSSKKSLKFTYYIVFEKTV